VHAVERRSVENFVMTGDIVPDDKDWTWVLERPCPECGFDAGALDIDGVGAMIRANAAAWVEVLNGDDASVRVRPSTDRWSTLEYGAHVRDVFVLYLERLSMMLDTDDPLYPNWDQDETAIASRYDLQQPARGGGRVASSGRGARRCVRRGGRRPVAASGSALRRGVVHGRIVRKVPGPRSGPPPLGLRGARTVGIMTSASTIVDAARDLAELIEANADDGERIRRLPLTTVKALNDAQLMRMCVPEVYGGPEVDPVTLVEAIEAVAHSDGGAGWCTMIASTTSSMASLLPEESAREIYGDRTSITGGVFAPNGKGEATTLGGVDGFRVTGRWAWGSGTQHCRWVLGGALCDDGTFRLCWFPQSEVTFHDTWYTTGMRGSGSLDYSVTEASCRPHGRSSRR
jgi:hypothetical protein